MYLQDHDWFRKSVLGFMLSALEDGLPHILDRGVENFLRECRERCALRRGGEPGVGGSWPTMCFACQSIGRQRHELAGRRWVVADAAPGSTHCTHTHTHTDAAPGSTTAHTHTLTQHQARTAHTLARHQAARSSPPQVRAVPQWSALRQVRACVRAFMCVCVCAIGCPPSTRSQRHNDIAHVRLSVNWVAYIPLHAYIPVALRTRAGALPSRI